MEKNKLLQVREELLHPAESHSQEVDREEMVHAGEHDSEEVEVASGRHNRKRRRVHEQESEYEQKVRKFHKVCYLGRKREAAEFLEAAPELLWSTSYSDSMRQYLRASDWSSLGWYDQLDTAALYWALKEKEEVEMRRACA